MRVPRFVAGFPVRAKIGAGHEEASVFVLLRNNRGSIYKIAMTLAWAEVGDQAKHNLVVCPSELLA